MTQIETLELNDPVSVASRLASRLRHISRGVIAKARHALDIRRICDPVDLRIVYAVDSAYPSRAIDLVGLSLSLVAAVLVRYEKGVGVSTESVRRLIVSYFSEIEQDFVAALARKEERLLAIKALRDANLLLIDGEIIPYREAKGVWSEPITLSRRLLDAALNKGIPVIGVIKRSYSNELSPVLGVNMNDKSIASLVLRRGEYFTITPGLRDLRSRNCKIVFYKPVRGLSEAIKLEACIPSGHDDEVCSLIGYLCTNTGPTGLPWLIDLVDSLSKQQVSLVEAVRKLLMNKLAQGEEYMAMAYPTNPQEQRVQKR